MPIQLFGKHKRPDSLDNLLTSLQELKKLQAMADKALKETETKGNK